MEYKVYSEYIVALSKEYSERGYYNQESCFGDFIKIFDTEITDEAKGETTGIQHDHSYNYTELFIEVHYPDNLGSGNYDIRDGIKEHLDTCYPFPLISENRMEAFKKWIAEFVNFKGTESGTEKYVLIMTALYLDSLNRNCTLNWNIPNESSYREKIMNDEEYEMFVREIPQ